MRQPARIVVAALAALLAWPAAAAPCNVTLVNEAVLKQINALRTQHQRCGDRVFPGVAPLRWQPQLVEAAQRYAAELSRRGTLSHTGASGSTLAQRLGDARYAMLAAGENLASGPDSVTAALELWIGSPGHCANLMSADFTEVGLACDIRDDPRAAPYWVMELARPRSIRPRNGVEQMPPPAVRPDGRGAGP